MELGNAPAIKRLRNMIEFKLFLLEPKTAIVGFFEKGSALESVFMLFGCMYSKKFHFGCTTTPAVMNQLDENNSIIIHRAPHLQNIYEPSIVKFEGSSFDELKEFVQDNYHGLVGHRTPELARDFKAPLIVVYFDVDFDKNFAETSCFRNEVLKVAKEFAEKVHFAVSAKKDFENEINQLDYASTEKEALVVAYDVSNQKFVMRKPFCAKNLHSFVAKLEAAKLEPFRIPRPVPPPNSVLVKDVVAANFKRVIVDNAVDTLVTLYDPLCGGCKGLTSVLEEVAQKLSNETISFARIDVTSKNVPPGLEIDRCPTIFLLPKNDKWNGLPYDGLVNAVDIIKFVAKETTEELKNYDRQGIKKVLGESGTPNERPNKHRKHSSKSNKNKPSKS